MAGIKFRSENPWRVLTGIYARRFPIFIKGYWRFSYPAWILTGINTSGEIHGGGEYWFSPPESPDGKEEHEKESVRLLSLEASGQANSCHLRCALLLLASSYREQVYWLKIERACNVLVCYSIAGTRILPTPAYFPFFSAYNDFRSRLEELSEIKCLIRREIRVLSFSRGLAVSTRIFMHLLGIFHLFTQKMHETFLITFLRVWTCIKVHSIR